MSKMSSREKFVKKIRKERKKALFKSIRDSVEEYRDGSIDYSDDVISVLEEIKEFEFLRKTDMS